MIFENDNMMYYCGMSHPPQITLKNAQYGLRCGQAGYNRVGTKAGGEMDNEKIGKWLEIAKHFAGGEFWNDIFEQPGIKQMRGTAPSFKGSAEGRPTLLPMVDMLQADDEIVVLIDLPGVAKEQVELSAAAGVLYVKGTARPLFPGAE